MPNHDEEIALLKKQVAQLAYALETLSATYFATASSTERIAFPGVSQAFDRLEENEPTP